MHHLSPGDVSTQEYRDNLAMYRWYWYHDQNARAHRSTLMPDLSIVVAVYNNLYHTSKLINQLKTEALGAEIIVVNNASSDGTHEWLNAQKDITVIENSKNEGVSRAWNLGLSKAKGKVLAVLNNDIDVIPGGIVKLYSAAVRCGISCASMIRSNENLIGGKKVNQVANSDYANGEALFFRRDVWLNVGEFDESYHMAYFEDVDWSCRARISGYTWFCVEDAINHVPGQTSKLIPDIHKHITTNKSIFEQRYQQMGYGNHIAFDFCSLSNIIDTMNQIQKSRSEQPLARIYVFCEPQYNVLFESKNIDYVGLKNESLDCNIISDYYSMKSPLISANLISKEKRVLVSTLMCDRKKDSQMISLNAIEKLDYDSFDVYINIQSADPAEKFAEVYTWAQKQISKGTNVYIDTWEWKSDWSKTPAFDQDQARLVPICIARNMTLQAASCLQYDYLLQVDNDVIIPSDSIQRLIDEDSPIAGGVVPGRGCHSYAKYLSGHTIALENNRILVNCSTCGFLMLRRDVFEFMRYRTGSNLNGKHNLSEDPAFFEDALMVWGFGNPVILADLNADHWDNPNQPLTNNAAVNDTP
jgi:GT2 family glycosyltransferase